MASVLPGWTAGPHSPPSSGHNQPPGRSGPLLDCGSWACTPCLHRATRVAVRLHLSPPPASAPPTSHTCPACPSLYSPPPQTSSHSREAGDDSGLSQQLWEKDLATSLPAQGGREEKSPGSVSSGQQGPPASTESATALLGTGAQKRSPAEAYTHRPHRAGGGSGPPGASELRSPGWRMASGLTRTAAPHPSPPTQWKQSSRLMHPLSKHPLVPSKAGPVLGEQTWGRGQGAKRWGHPQPGMRKEMALALSREGCEGLPRS